MTTSTPLTSLDQLLEPFHAAEKPRSRWRIGTEAEKCGVHLDGSALAYAGERGIAAVLAGLVRQHGWFEEREYDDGDVIALRRGDASITLEPGGQLELSGAPLNTLHETCAEFRSHLRELAPISAELGIAWLGLGFHPFARREDLAFVPKLRYGVMREYLPTRGGHGLDMMLRTATVQANLDYASERDAIRKLRIALRLQPIVTAMFANSPFVEGRITGERSHRAAVWLDVDPDRSGLLDFAWDESDMGYQRYVEWALDVPMFLVKRDGRVLRNTGQTFRRFLADGFEGERATLEDWTTHINTLFPEVRLKKTLEMRGADSLPTDLVCALPSIWKGLLYEDHAITAAESLASEITLEEAKAARADIASRALRARLGAREVGAWASDVVRIALGGLERLSNLNKSGEDERIHLARLAALVKKGMSPADALLERIDPEAPLVSEVLAHAHL